MFFGGFLFSSSQKIYFEKFFLQFIIITIIPCPCKYLISCKFIVTATNTANSFLNSIYLGFHNNFS